MSLTPAPRRTARILLAALAGVVLVTSAAPLSGATEAAKKKAPAKKACVLKKKAKCKKVKLTKVKVGKVNLTGANLAGATITGAKFNGTNLTGVNLSGAKITNTTFTGANVTGLDLRGATLSGVTFNRVRAAGQSANATESECTATEGAVPNGTTYYSITCARTGVNMLGASIARWTRFDSASIPGSDFSGVTTPVICCNVLEFRSTDVSRSTFHSAKVALHFWKSTVRTSVFDWSSGIRKMEETDVSGSTFMYASEDNAVKNALNENIWTGARGLDGTTAVTISAAYPPPVGLEVAIVREDGYFKPGVNCPSLPCAYPTAAVGAPGKVVVGGKTPFALEIPGWTCGSATPVLLDGATTWSATCTVASIPASGSSGTVGPPPRSVTVNARGPGGLAPHAILSIRIEVLGADGNPADTTTCTAVASCRKTVAKGSRVRITMEDSDLLLGTCTPTAAPLPGTTVICPVVEVNEDLLTTVEVTA